MDETRKLIKNFYYNNKSLVISNIFFEIAYSLIEFIVIPILLSDAFNNIENIEILKKQLIKLVLSWIIIKITYSISIYFHNKIEPELSKYIILTIMKAIFKKYENENKITDISVFLDKINLIKNNIHEFSYLLFTVFIPRTIVLLMNCFTIFMVNKKLGIIIFCSILMQCFILTRGLEKCTEATASEFKNKDIFYEYIEDIFQNLNTIQSTNNGFDFELNRLYNIVDNLKKSERDVTSCINNKQYLGYTTNIIIFSICIYSIYNSRVKGELSNNNTTKVLLLTIGIFNNMSEMTFYIPNMTYKISILKSNNNFLKDILGDYTYNNQDSDFSLENFNNNITFKNVSFNYGDNTIFKNLDLVLPENKIISIYGGIGTGKSTFVKLIFKILKPEQGSILIGDKDISDWEPRKFRKYISYIDQNSNQLFNRTILENILYGHEEKGEDGDIIEKIKNIIQTFNLYSIFEDLDADREKWSFLGNNAGKLGQNLSGGQKQIVHLIRIELNDFTKIVILDEPTSHLDVNARDKVLELVKNIKNRGKTIIIITHDENCKKISDNVIQFSKNENPTFV